MAYRRWLIAYHHLQYAISDTPSAIGHRLLVLLSPAGKSHEHAAADVLFDCERARVGLGDAGRVVAVGSRALAAAHRGHHPWHASGERLHRRADLGSAALPRPSDPHAHDLRR